MAIVSASRCAAETEQGAHVFEITGYSLHRGLGVGRFLRSATFAVGGHDWSVLLYPDGVDEHRRDCISVAVELMSANGVGATAAPVRATSSLCFFHRVTRMFSWSSPPDKFTFGRPTSWRHYFFSVRRSLLEESGYAAGDCVMIKCVVAVVKAQGPSAWDVITHCQSAAMGEAIACIEGLRLGIANCTSNLIIETDCASVVESFREDSSDRSESLLETKEHADVTFEVGGEEFAAHRLVLAMRSPVFKAELYGLTMEKDTAGPHCR
ncbi:hypothetical protein QYE76_000491 [Lolium multiflorum]|uniref:Uncharacterized protein n=1 Tax=Lolium multiflorum TaxID=4521 RepID=A0AAD8VYT2_LOLMU|nr:hypothetical protein QYE76_000491 [Lolium multiflorum]